MSILVTARQRKGALMKKKLRCDRTEEGIEICFDEDGNRYEIQECLTEGDIIIAEISENGDVTDIEKLSGETENVKAENSSRLAALFERGKNNK